MPLLDRVAPGHSPFTSLVTPDTHRAHEASIPTFKCP